MIKIFGFQYFRIKNLQSRKFRDLTFGTFGTDFVLFVIVKSKCLIKNFRTQYFGTKKLQYRKIRDFEFPDFRNVFVNVKKYLLD